MINRKIEVVLYNNYKTGEWCKNAPDKYGNEYYDDQDFNEYFSYDDFKKDSEDPSKSPNRKRFWSRIKRVFTKFTNTGKLSKSELKDMTVDEVEAFKPVAEEELANVLKIEVDTPKDTERALELAKIVNSASWDYLSDKDLAVIKFKNSHSSWYSNGEGAMHAPSEYLTLVPVSVAQEAKELQAIRRKHQNDSTFNFSETLYNCKEVRISDHNNPDIDSLNSDADWKDIFNCDFL